MTDRFDPEKELTINEIEDFLKLPLQEKEHGYEECKHKKVLLDDQNHTVECQDCKKILDPFWYLQLLAKEWHFRRYRDSEAIKAYRKIQEQEKNARAKGHCYVRPKDGNGAICWDIYESYHGHPPEYVFYRGGWYAGENGSATLMEYLQQCLVEKNKQAKP